MVQNQSVPFVFELITSTERKFSFAGKSWLSVPLFMSRQDECRQWMHFIEENSYSSLRQLYDEAEQGIRSMATVLVVAYYRFDR